MSDRAKLIERLFVYAAIIILIAFAYFKYGNGIVEPQTTITLKYDSIPKVINNSHTEKPVVYKAGEINIPPAQLNILQSTDTSLLRQVLHEVLARYYEVNVHHTTTADTSLIVDTWDTICQNQLQGRKLQYKILRPTQIITNNPPVRNKVFAGFYLEAGANGLYSVAPEISFENKKGTLLRLNYNAYNLATGKDKYSFGVGIAQKISLRRK